MVDMLFKEMRGLRATHYTSENIMDDGTHTNWMASRPDGTREAHDDAWDKGEASGPGKWGARARQRHEGHSRRWQPHEACMRHDKQGQKADAHCRVLLTMCGDRSGGLEPGGARIVSRQL